MAAAVVNRFPPDPAEPRLGKQLLLLCRRCYCFGAGGLATTQSSVTWLFDHDPANECLVTGLFRIALVQRSKNTVRCCDLWPVLVFLAEARGILRLRLTITYHEGRGSAWSRLSTDAPNSAGFDVTRGARPKAAGKKSRWAPARAARSS